MMPTRAEAQAEPVGPPVTDFTGSADVVRVLAEGERLSFGHMFNPAFATEVSQIDPLPHQRIAVYEHMLKQFPLRFLLADDAGAGKTIMSGLFIRERQGPPHYQAGADRRSRRPDRQLEKRTRHALQPSIPHRHRGRCQELPTRSSAKTATASSSASTLWPAPKMFARLKEPGVVPYDLVIFDEAHKLSANRGNDLRVTKTDRYQLAEALAGVGGLDEAWTLPWAAHHLLLLTATPHQGKDYPYYALWRCWNRRCFQRWKRSTNIRPSVASPTSSAAPRRKWFTSTASRCIPSVSPTPWATT